VPIRLDLSFFACNFFILGALFQRFMREDLNLLFLGGAKRVSVAEYFIAAGDRLGKKVNIFSYELSSDVPISFIGKIILGLKWKDLKVQEDLIRIIKENHIHILIPFLDPATITAAQLKDQNAPVWTPVSGTKACEIFFDKIMANEWFIQNQFPVPNENGFPRIAKPRKGSASQGIVVLKDDLSLSEFISQYPDAEKDYLIQKYIEGEEWSVDCFVSSKGEIISVVPRRRLETSGGEAVKSVTVRDEEIIELSKKMIKASNLTGPLTIQFIRDKKTGKNYFMEVNPRLGGGVVTSIGAGADIPEMILKEYLGITLSPVEDWKSNLLMIRAYREFFRYADYH
jgi:carbamoyl-phosphate synthase large subunit